MKSTDYVALMARYNRWMNDKLYTLVRDMPAAAVYEDRKAFFSSIFGTLDHIAFADMIWLKRFSAALGAPSALAALSAYPDATSMAVPLTKSLEELCKLRVVLDDAIDGWTATLDDEVLARPIDYRNMAGEPFTRSLFQLLMHFFNHQTHHRGQATTLFTQAGIEVGPTDLALLLPDVSAATP
jgi:uncharacterized damage-inducible protein DinB